MKKGYCSQKHCEKLLKVALKTLLSGAAVFVCVSALSTDVHAAYIDHETATGSIGASSLDMKATSQDAGLQLSTVAENMVPGDSVTRTAKVENVGGVDFHYNVVFEKVDGDDALCEALKVEVQRNGSVVYDGGLSDLDSETHMLAVDAHDEWIFTITAPDDTPLNEECSFRFAFTAWQTEFDNPTSGWVDGETIDDNTIHTGIPTPVQTGYNEKNSSSDDPATPRDPNEFACMGGVTHINAISIHWTDVAHGNAKIKYQRQYKKEGAYGWRGSEIYTHPYTNYRTFGGNPGHDGTYGSRVRAWFDEDNDNVVDADEPVSEWSNECSITYDGPPARPTGLRRIAPHEGNKVYECGTDDRPVYSKIQKMWPDWDDNTEPDFDHYEYTSFNAPDGSIGIEKRVFTDSIFQYNGVWLPHEGTYGFAVRAVDTAGNKSAWAVSDESLDGSCQVTYDATEPTSTISTPVEGVFYQNTSITIQGQSVDALSGVDHVDLSYAPYDENTDTCDPSGVGYTHIGTISNPDADDPNNNTSFTWSYSWTPSTDGTYCIKASATDNVGNSEHSPIVKGITYRRIAPALAILRFDPNEIDTTDSEQTVDVYFKTASDSHIGGPSRTSSVPSYILFVSPSGNKSVTALLQDATAEGDGVYKASVTFPRDAEQGEWVLRRFFLVDDNGNYAQWLTDDLLRQELPVTIYNGVSASVDTEAPILESISIAPHDVNTDYGPQTVTVRMHITDRGTGLDTSTYSGTKFIIGNAGTYQDGRINAVEKFIRDEHRTSGTQQDGKYEITVDIPQWAAQGEWTFTYIALTDNMGNTRRYEVGDLGDFGDLIVTNHAESPADTQHPVLEDATTVTPMVINTEDHVQDVTVQFRVTDNITGLAAGDGYATYRPYLMFYPVGGGTGLRYPITDDDRTSGTDQDGTYSITVTFPRGARSGEWMLMFYLPDYAGNVAVYSDYLKITNKAMVSDTEAPVLEAFDFTPKVVNTVDGAKEITFTARVRDDMSGLDGMNVEIEAANGEEDGFLHINGADCTPTGTSGEVECTGSITLRKGSYPGTWTVVDVWLGDVVSNARQYETRDLVDAGFPTEIENTQVVLNEFMPQPAVGKEWVELRNISNDNVDVDGWYIADSNGQQRVIDVKHTNTGSTTIEPGERLVIQNYRSFYLNNNGDAVKLFDNEGNLVDEYEYDADAVEEGKSIARDWDHDGAWVDPIPTPGKKNNISNDKDEMRAYYKEHCFDESGAPLCSKDFMKKYDLFDERQEEGDTQRVLKTRQADHEVGEKEAAGGDMHEDGAQDASASGSDDKKKDGQEKHDGVAGDTHDATDSAGVADTETKGDVTDKSDDKNGGDKESGDKKEGTDVAGAHDEGGVATGATKGDEKSDDEDADKEGGKYGDSANSEKKDKDGGNGTDADNKKAQDDEREMQESMKEKDGEKEVDKGAEKSDKKEARKKEKKEEEKDGDNERKENKSNKDKAGQKVKSPEKKEEKGLDESKDDGDVDRDGNDGDDQQAPKLVDGVVAPGSESV